MTLEEFRIYQEQTFDAFCKKTIRNESIDAHREMATRARQEVSMSGLNMGELLSLENDDLYHIDRTTYYVRNSTVHVDDPALGEALQYIVPQKRDILLLFYFLGYSDLQISRLLKLNVSTVRYRRCAALHRLKELLEAMEYGK